MWAILINTFKMVKFIDLDPSNIIVLENIPEKNSKTANWNFTTIVS